MEARNLACDKAALVKVQMLHRKYAKNLFELSCASACFHVFIQHTLTHNIFVQKGNKNWVQHQQMYTRNINNEKEPTFIATYKI